MAWVLWPSQGAAVSHHCRLEPLEGPEEGEEEQQRKRRAVEVHDAYAMGPSFPTEGPINLRT